MDKRIATREKKRKKSKARVLSKGWFENNIFKYKRWDGILYLVLYICIPVLITGVSLSALPDDNTSIIYCYISILISAINGFYDAANRWDNVGSPIINLKAFIIGFVNIIICVYSAYVILCIAISNNINCRHDWILLIYFVTIVIAMIDVLCCFVKNMALNDLMKEEL